MLYHARKKRVKSRAKIKLIQQAPLICNIKLHPLAPRFFFLPGHTYHDAANNSQGWASSALMYCSCKYVICHIQQFPCNKLLKKRYVLPRYSNLWADSRLNFIWTFSMTFCSSFCLSKVEHLSITFLFATGQCFIKQIGDKNEGDDYMYIWYNPWQGTAINVLKYPPPQGI